MTRVATYVFVDLETTGLPKYEYNRTRITELSMVAVRRTHILDTRPGAAPRVQEKLTLCFNPRRAIHPDSSDVSGLDNDLLEHQTPFNMNVFNTINSFIQCFQKPVCLVAQNGHNFDFPILKNHFEKIGVSLPDDILCADSLHGFYDIESGRNREYTGKVGLSVVDYKTNGVKADESSDDQKQNNQTSDKVVDGSRIDKQICNISKDFEENDDLKSQQNIQQQNERTPIQKRDVPKVTMSSNTVRQNKVRRKIFYNKPGTEPSKKPPSTSYKLKDFYERSLGRPGIDAHRAENDCVMAMEASVAIAKEFVEWVDNADNQCKFSEVNAMKLGVPLGD